MGWELLTNGKLLQTAASARFDVFLTIDKNLKFQQNLATLPIAVVVLLAPNNRFATLTSFVPAILDALNGLESRKLVEIPIPNP
jgi:hypothetical protein